MSDTHRQGSAAGIKETRRAIDAALAATDYSCKKVSWDDVSRSTVNGSVSCWGSNITDTYLKAKDGRSLFTVRSDNWNEKLGIVRAEDVALLFGNCEANSGMHNITLKQFLDNPAACGASYAGVKPKVKLSHVAADRKVSIRFQTVFLPVEEDAHGRGTMLFATEAYNYQTADDDDPRNIVLLATTQGLSVQADGVGAKRLLLHAGTPGNVSEYWLEAESSRHKVGGEQKETKEEREDALKRGKATSEVIGIKAMGTRFNVLMTIQIPILQKPTPRRSQRHRQRRRVLGGFGPRKQLAVKSARLSAPAASRRGGIHKKGVPRSSAVGANFKVADPSPVSSLDGGSESSGTKVGVMEDDTIKQGVDPVAPGKALGKLDLTVAVDVNSAVPPSLKQGHASAARVSRGDFHGMHKRLSVTRPRRSTEEHVTVTCVLYNTVIGGVPNEIDVMAAVHDMDMLFANCSASGRLADAAFDFMKTELTDGDIVMAKFGALEKASVLAAAAVLELRLMILGAVQDSKVSAVLVRKLDAIANYIDAGRDLAAKAILPELKLLLVGIFSTV